ncbi:MAG: hypothetical protein QOF01_1513 [Thermomicrobiales bacterium]|nr:hypothetical protein [Thermomicrobiales bacterium]
MASGAGTLQVVVDGLAAAEDAVAPGGPAAVGEGYKELAADAGNDATGENGADQVAELGPHRTRPVSIADAVPGFGPYQVPGGTPVWPTSSSGSTPSASARHRIVAARGERTPSSRRLIDSWVTPLCAARSSWVRPAARRSERSCAPARVRFRRHARITSFIAWHSTGDPDRPARDRSWSGRTRHWTYRSQHYDPSFIHLRACHQCQLCDHAERRSQSWHVYLHHASVVFRLAVALDGDDGLQGVDDLDEILLLGEDLRDVLVGLGRLVEEAERGAGVGAGEGRLQRCLIE